MCVTGSQERVPLASSTGTAQVSSMSERQGGWRDNEKPLGMGSQSQQSGQRMRSGSELRLKESVDISSRSKLANDTERNNTG